MHATSTGLVFLMERGNSLIIEFFLNKTLKAGNELPVISPP